MICFLRIAQHVQKLVEQSDVHEEPNATVLTPKIKKYISNGHSACQCSRGLMKTNGESAVSNTGVSVVSSMSRLEKFSDLVNGRYLLFSNWSISAHAIMDDRMR